MNKKIIVVGLIALGVAIKVIAGDKPPTETQGLKADVLQQNNLGAQLPALKDHDLRARFIRWAPGATITEHSHAERPGVVYVVKGGIIEYRNGERIEYKEGDSWIEDAETTHWAKNASMEEESVIFMVDLPPKE